jgi:hypothetical protein
MTPEQIRDRIFHTYFLVRRGLLWLAFAFPLLLLAVGSWNQIHLGVSMSEYYFAFYPHDGLRVFPVRAVFVGVLFVLGICLILYRGFSNTEDRVLDLAGVMAVIAALWPMQAPDYCKNCGSTTFSYVHEGAGIILFLCMAFVAFACADETLVQLPDPQRKRFRIGYFVLAALLLVAPVAVGLLAYKLGRSDSRLFYAEWAAMWIFAAYWGLKTYELSKSNLEVLAMKGEMPIRQLPANPSLRQRASRLLD